VPAGKIKPSWLGHLHPFDGLLLSDTFISRGGGKLKRGFVGRLK
jgi:hypothetical protein